MTADQILKLIAEGYYDGQYEDRYIILNNPKYQDGTINGESEDPYIIWDIYLGEEA